LANKHTKKKKKKQQYKNTILSETNKQTINKTKGNKQANLKPQKREIKKIVTTWELIFVYYSF